MTILSPQVIEAFCQHYARDGNATEAFIAHLARPDGNVEAPAARRST